MIDLLIELGGRVAQGLDAENEGGHIARQRAVVRRVYQAKSRTTIHVGGGSAPTRKSRRAR